VRRKSPQLGVLLWGLAADSRRTDMSNCSSSMRNLSKPTFAVVYEAQSAQGLSEYGLILSLVSVFAIAAVTLFGGDVTSLVGGALGAVVQSFPAP